MLDLRSHTVPPSDSPSSMMDACSTHKDTLNPTHLASPGHPCPAPPVTKSWSEVVADKTTPTPSGFSLEFIPPSSPPSDGNPVLIRPPTQFLKEGNRRWNTCLVGNFLHSRLPFKLVADSVHKLWNKFGLQKVFLQGNGCFVFQFSKSEDRDNVLALGPWYIANKLILLKHSKEGLDFQSESCLKAPVWVKLSNVPMSYWLAKGLSMLASGLGKPILADKITQ